MSIKVFIIEDHYVTRQGIRMVLESDDEILITGEAATGKDALAKIPLRQPDVVVSDFQLSGDMTGVDVILALQQEGYHTPFLILSGYDDPTYVRAAFTAGAKGYMLKDEYGPTIVAAVKQVARGELYYSPTLARYLPDNLKSPFHLTEQEERVLKLVARGLTNKEIAEALGIAEGTVGFHVGNLFEKTEVNHRGKLTAWAWKNGYGEI